jgi:hypothetical protein
MAGPTEAPAPGGQEPYVVSPITGTVVRAKPEELRALKREGYTAATAEQAQQLQDEETLGAAAPVVGFGTGVLKAIPGSTHAIDWAARQLAESRGDDPDAASAESLRRLQAYGELSPIASTAGEMLAFAAGGEVLGVGRLGAAGGRLLGGAGTAGRVAGAAITGGIEGAAMGGTTELNESLLTNKPLTAESLITAMGTGALIGGGLGAAMSGGGAAVRAGLGRLGKAAASPGKEGAEAILARAFGETDETVTSRLGNLWAEGSELAGVEGAGALRVAGSATAEGKALRKYMVESAQIIEREGLKAATGFKKLHGMIRDAGERFKGPFKSAELTRAMSTETREAATKLARRETDVFISELDAMIAGGKGRYGKQGTLKQLRARASALAEDMGDDPVKGFMGLDGLKRDVGEEVSRLKRSTGGVKGATKGRLRDSYERMRTALEHETWGDAGRLQATMNAPWAESIQAKATSKMGRVLEHADAGFGETIEQVSEEKLRKALANPQANPELLEGISAYVSHGEDFVRAARENLQLAPAQRTALEGFEATLTEVKGALKEVSRAGKAGEQYAALGGGDGALAGGLLFGGLATGHPAAGLVASAVLNPRGRIRQIAAIERLAGGVGAKVARGAKRALGTDAAGRVGRGARRAAVWAATGEARRTDRDAGTVLAASPEAAGSTAVQRLAAVSEGAPDTVAIAQQIIRGDIDYLSAHAPRGHMRPDVLGAPPIPPGHGELERWERRRRAISDPLTLIGDLRSGKLITPEAIHALSARRPEVLGMIRSQLRTGLTDMATAGKTLPYDRARAVATVLGQPVDPIDSAKTVSEIGAMYMAMAEKGAQMAPPSARQDADTDMADALRGDSDLESIE